MIKFILGVVVILICTGSLVTSSEHSSKGLDYQIVHWLLGFVAGIGVTILTAIAIFK